MLARRSGRVAACDAVATRAELLVLVAWGIAGLAIVGFGFLFRRAARVPAVDADDVLSSFWLGWCCLLLGLQVWHLLLPVDRRAQVACGLVAAIGLAIGGLGPWRRLVPRRPRHAVAFGLLAAMAVWLSNHALGGARHGDTGAYFLPTVRWLVAYPIVPGLGNLHAHFALNQSYFLYVAALEVGPFAGRSYHLANGLLLLALCARMTLAVSRFVGRDAVARPVDLFYALILPAALPLGAGIFFTSPSPDPAVFALGVVTAGELLGLLTGDPGRRDFQLRALALLAFTGWTVKLSFAGFAAATLPIALVAWLWIARPNGARAMRSVGAVALIGVLAIGPWIVRNVVMSGRPLFPSALGELPVEWRVRTDVEGWLRHSAAVGGIGPIVRNPRWFLNYLRGQGWESPDVLGPLVVGVAGAVVAGVRRLIRGRSSTGRALVVAVPAVASLLFCLVTSPVARYVGASVWVLGASAIVASLGDMVLAPRTLRRAVVVVTVVALTTVMLRSVTDPLWLDATDFEARSPVAYHKRRLKTGLVVNVPRISDACWDVPLPCTGYPNPALRLRRDGDLAAGFMIDPALQARYRYEPGRGFIK